MSPLKSSPLEGNKAPFVRGFMYIYQGAKREPGVGVKERTGREVGWGGGLRGRLSNCLHVNFKLNSPCPGTIYTLNANLFFFFPLSLLLLRSLLFFFLFGDTWLLMEKCKWTYVWKVWPFGFAEMLQIRFARIRTSDLQQVSNTVTASTWQEFSFLRFKIKIFWRNLFILMSWIEISRTRKKKGS